MINTPIHLQDLRRSIYVKAKVEPKSMAPVLDPTDERAVKTEARNG
jgi:hypothetical protein